MGQHDAAGVRVAQRTVEEEQGNQPELSGCGRWREAGGIDASEESELFEGGGGGRSHLTERRSVCD